MCTFYFQPKVEAVENRRVTRFVPARLETLANLEKAKYVASIIPETPSENQMVVNGVRHNYVQRITEYNVKYRYILTVYCMPDQYNHVHEYLADMVQTRDDVYVAVTVAGVNDIPQLTQVGGTNKDLNVLDDGSGCCERAFAWYAQEYRAFYEKTMSEYKRQMERYERLREIRAEIENEDEK